MLPELIETALYLRLSSGPQEDGCSLDEPLKDGLARRSERGRAPAAIYRRNLIKHNRNLAVEWKVRKPGVGIRAQLLDDAVWAWASALLGDPGYLGQPYRRCGQAARPTSTSAPSNTRSVRSRVAKPTSNAPSRARTMTRRAPSSARAGRSYGSSTRACSRNARRGSTSAGRGWMPRHSLARMGEWLAELGRATHELPYTRRRQALRGALNVRVTVYRHDDDPRWEMTAEVPLECSRSSYESIENTPF